MYTKFDLENISIENLAKYPNHWFYRTELALLVGEQYQLVGKLDEFHFGHFCFVWEKLLINDNFVITREHLGQKQIKLISANSHISNFDPNTENINIDLVIDFKSQINHMTEFPELYYESSIIKKFLINNFGSEAENMYNFFDLYLDSDSNIEQLSTLSKIDKNKSFLLLTNTLLISLGGAIFGALYYIYKF